MAKILFLVIFSLSLALSLYYVGYRCQQQEFVPLLGAYGFCFGVYALVLKTATTPFQLKWYLVLGIALRVLLLFSSPNLSDDVYRYLWDGQLCLNGLNPFVYTPTDYLQDPPLPSGLSEELYQKLNSPDYHSVYPPLAQALFMLGIALSPGDWTGSILVMKLVLLLAELGTLLLLSRLLEAYQLPRVNLLFYALNPLILLELMGNVHLEALMIFFTLLALYCMQKGKATLASLAWSGAIAAKLLPLMFIPLLLRRWGWPQASKRYLAWIAGALFVLFLPLLNWKFLKGLVLSLDLYFQHFEFNASVYYLLRWVFWVLTGYNPIWVLGPILGLITLYGIVKLAKMEQDLSWQKLPSLMLLVFSLYLFNATIIHPWYLALPIALAGLTPFRFPILWSGLAILSYSHYQGGNYQENYLLITLEYCVLACFLYLERGKILLAISKEKGPPSAGAAHHS